METARGIVEADHAFIEYLMQTYPDFRPCTLYMRLVTTPEAEFIDSKVTNVVSSGKYVGYAGFQIGPNVFSYTLDIRVDSDAVQITYKKHKAAYKGEAIASFVETATKRNLYQVLADRVANLETAWETFGRGSTGRV